MKTFKSMPKECCVSMINKAQALFIVITALLLISTSSYSKNNLIVKPKLNLQQVKTLFLDSIIKKIIITSDLPNTNERLIIKLNELDKLAEFPGGMEKFYEKVIAKLVASELSYTGFTQIHASFVIEKDGSMSGIVVDSTLDSELKKEIIDGLKSIKAKWSPATLDNKPVRISYSLPIVLNLD